SFKSSKKIIFPQPTENNLDLDEKTISIFKEKIMKAKTIFWNGPFGKIEDPKFQRGTLEICKAILKSKALSLIGGGETLEFTNSHRLTKKFTLVSSAGGAMLEFLGGKKLPALISLGYYDKQQ
ncbi:phosphoglycerate kinase, partial [Candidatus Parcubacteria bacterium]|nr:phosphoglycerate kinase [Candidatus Parcubacteria bacterium]